jgi:hypothetical protein
VVSVLPLAVSGPIVIAVSGASAIALLLYLLKLEDRGQKAEDEGEDG